MTKYSEASEKALERYLVERSKAIGVLALKYSSATTVGYPDRLLVVPGGTVVWVEVKSAGQHPRKIQALRHEELKRLGHVVYVVDSREGIDSIITSLENFLEDCDK